MQTLLTWSIGKSCGTARLQPHSAWRFGSQPKAHAQDVCFQHPSISSLALLVRVDELGTQVERLQRGNGATVVLDDGRARRIPLEPRHSHRLGAGETSVMFAVADFEMLLVVDVLWTATGSGGTKVPTPKELDSNDALLMCTLAAALAARGKVTGPELCLAWANWRGKLAQPSTEAQGTLLVKALASLGRESIPARTNKVDLLVSLVERDFDSDYLAAMWEDLTRRRHAIAG